MRHCSFTLIECCPWRSPLSASSRFAGRLSKIGQCTGCVQQQELALSLALDRAKAWHILVREQARRFRIPERAYHQVLLFSGAEYRKENARRACTADCRYSTSGPATARRAAWRP